MARKHSVSKVDLLPEPIRLTVGRLLAANHTIDDVVAHLRQLEAAGEVFDMPSRSGVGRWAERMRATQQRIKDTTAIAGALAPSFGDSPDDRTGRLAAELLKAGIFDLLTAVEIDQETGQALDVKISAKEAGILSGALRDLASRDKIDADRTLKIKQETAKEAAKAVDRVGREKGLTAETVADIKHAILGVAA